MRFVPYVLQRRDRGGQYRIFLFLERGRALQIADDATTFCEDNGFAIRGAAWDAAGTRFQQIDASRTPMAEFYEWNELAEDDPRECWRCFHHAPAYLAWREETDVERLVGEVLRQHAIFTIERGSATI